MTRGVLKPLAGIVVFPASFSVMEKCLRLRAVGLYRNHSRRRIFTITVALSVLVTSTMLIVFLTSRACLQRHLHLVAVGLHRERHQRHILTVAVSLANRGTLARIVVLLTSCPSLERFLRDPVSFRRQGNCRILGCPIPRTLLCTIARLVIFLAPLALLQRKLSHTSTRIRRRRRNYGILAIAISRSLLDTASRLVVLLASLTLLWWRLLHRSREFRCIWQRGDAVGKIRGKQLPLLQLFRP
jgi:hypothetical protein